MIERDIKVIRKNQTLTRTKTAKELKNLSSRLTKHDKQFQSLNASIVLLPTKEIIQEMIEATIPSAIRISVNGKIDHLTELTNTNTEKIDMVGEHLKKQDMVAEEQGAAIKELNEKIRPFDGIKKWATETVRGILYVGGIAVAVYAIIKIFQIHLFK